MAATTTHTGGRRRGPEGLLQVVAFKARPSTMDELRRYAAASGTKPTTLIREIVERGVAELATQLQ
jgi:hypothetical protein